MIRFGPAGAADSFAAMGYKKTAQMPEYLEKMGLTAFEYQCGRGVRITDEAARALGEGFRQRDIAVSLHAPYYISMSSLDEEKRLGSLRYILESARAVTAMGGRRIVIHAGSTAKMPRAEALELALDTFRRAIAALDEAGYSQVIPCPEVMGKLGQLGDLSEVLAMCGVDERMLPCIDFGHLNARTFGTLKTRADYAAVLDAIENAIGLDRARQIHCHFSKIEYTKNGGEKRHLTFADTVYGPEFEPLAEEFYRRGYSPVVICESAGTQAEDAVLMQNAYQKASLAGEKA